MQIYDYAGNQKTVDIVIQNIDKQKPTLDITYNVTTLTNQTVTAYIRANEKIKKADGWTLSEDQKTLTKTYSSNQTETVSITDLAGNTSTATINIVNIDKQNPIVEITYSTTSPTFNDVIVTIASNEELRGLEGWQLSSNKKSLSKTYTNNNEETIIVYDLAGNSATANIKIENIDKEKPQYEITYSTTLATNKDVTVTITANKEIQRINGWTLSQDKKVLTKTYTENSEEEIIIQDLAGNKSSKTIIAINNIDKTAPVINVSYSKVSPTTKDVLVTLTSNEVIRNVADWTLSANSMQLSKIYRANTTEQITITDEAGNSITLSIEVSNIPEVPPEDDGNSEDTPTPGGEVNLSQEDTTDPAASSQTVSTQGGKTSSSQTDTSNSTEPKVNVRVIKSTDTTTSNKILPQTGEKSILIFIAVLAIISTVAYLKFRKYRL